MNIMHREPPILAVRGLSSSLSYNNMQNGITNNKYRNYKMNNILYNNSVFKPPPSPLALATSSGNNKMNEKIIAQPLITTIQHNHNTPLFLSSAG